MNQEKMRKLFEKRFKIPECIFWNKDHYSGKTSDSTDFRVADLYNTKLSVFKAGIIICLPEIRSLKSRIASLGYTIAEKNLEIIAITKMNDEVANAQREGE